VVSSITWPVIAPKLALPVNPRSPRAPASTAARTITTLVTAPMRPTTTRDPAVRRMLAVSATNVAKAAIMLAIAVRVARGKRQVVPVGPVLNVVRRDISPVTVLRVDRPVAVVQTRERATDAVRKVISSLAVPKRNEKSPRCEG